MDTQDAQHLRVTLAAVEEFGEAFESLMELLIENEEPMGRGLFPAAFPREDTDGKDLLERTKRVSRAAGRAGNATSLTGGYVQVAGLGEIDPIAAWKSMLDPKPVLEPTNIRDAIQIIAGRLEARIARADASGPIPLGLEGLYPLVWSAAAPLWRSGLYRHAVGTAAETVVSQVKARSGRNDLGEADLWRQLFSSAEPKEGEPRLRWPGDAKDRNTSTMISGLRDLGLACRWQSGTLPLTFSTSTRPRRPSSTSRY